MQAMTQNKTKKAFSSLEQQSAALKKSWGGLAAEAAATAVKNYADFDDALTVASARFSGLNMQTAEGQKQFTALKDTAYAVGGKTIFSPSDAAKAEEEMAEAGKTVSQTISMLPKIALFAEAMKLSLSDAASVAMESMGALGVNSKGLSNLSGQMIATTKGAHLNLGDLLETIKTAGPAFKSMGQSSQTFFASVRGMTNAGMKQSMVGSQLQKAALSLASPTAGAVKELESLSVKTLDAQGNARDFLDIIGELSKGLQGMGKQQKSASVAAIFGSQAQKGMLALINSGATNLKKMSSGITQKTAEQATSSLSAKILILISAIDALSDKVVAAFAGDMKTAIVQFTGAINSVDPTKIADALKLICGGFKLIVKYWPEVAAAFAAYDAGMITMIALSAAEDALNPFAWVGLAVEGITALAVAIVGLEHKFKFLEKIGAGFKTLWKWETTTDMSPEDQKKYNDRKAAKSKNRIDALGSPMFDLVQTPQSARDNAALQNKTSTTNNSGGNTANSHNTTTTNNYYGVPAPGLSIGVN